MKMFNNFKIWFGKKLIDCGFGILLKLDAYDWNQKHNRYPGSVKQFKYLLGSWFVTQGMRVETKGLSKLNWPGYKDYEYFNDKFYIKKIDLNKLKKDYKKFNDEGGLDGFFKNWGNGNS
jgi:hypothetical protein